jgi:hypothetical protein
MSEQIALCERLGADDNGISAIACYGKQSEDDRGEASAAMDISGLKHDCRSFMFHRFPAGHSILLRHQCALSPRDVDIS